MRSRPTKHRIGMVSLGCAKNLVDAEQLMKQLEASHFKLIFDPATSRGLDTAIVNTCGFIGDAKTESIDTILQFVDAKRRGDIRNLYVMGCLSQRYKDDLIKEIPEVDAFFGVNDLKKIIQHLGGEYRSNLLGERTLTTPAHYAYLKIAEGCDRKCSFCAIPLIRGRHRSRSVKEILTEARYLVAQGVREINLISQDTTYYGLDRYGKRKLPELLEKLAGVQGLEWLRLHYTYPHGFPVDLLDVMARNPNISRYIDIPLQHISSRILTSMRRQITDRQTRSLVDTIRNKIPGVAIRTTFIVGYPGETVSEFNELKQFVRTARFDRMGVFTYSPEEETHAFGLKDTVSQSVKQDRAEELMAIQEEISRSLNNNRIGTGMKVVVDRTEGGYHVARSEFDSPEIDNEILIPVGIKKIKPGTFAQAIITGADSFDLFAEFS